MRNIEFKGGRKPPVFKPAIELKDFLTTVDHAPSVDYYSKVTDWPMLLNDRYGDCTVAAALHHEQCWNMYSKGVDWKGTDDQALEAYEHVTVPPFDPNTGANDNGAVMQDVLSYWRSNGIGGKKILAFAKVDHTNPDEMYAACDIFGGVYLGINFPDSAMDQFNRELPWKVVKGAKIEGGHAINAVGYDSSNGDWRVITWGAVQEMYDDFFSAYVEEAWVIITEDWLNDGKTYEGLDLTALGERFHDLTGEDNPFPPGPKPGPTPMPKHESFWSKVWRWIKDFIGA